MTDLSLQGELPHSVRHQDWPASVSSAGSLSAEVLTGPDAYAELRSPWAALATRQPDVVCFQMPDMLTVWARHFCRRPSELRTVVVRDAARPVLIWPLHVQRKGPLTIASGAGAPIAQYDDILIDPDCDSGLAIGQAMQAIGAEIRPDLMTFSHVRPNGWLVQALGPASEIVCDVEGAPFADLSGGVEAVRAGLKTKVRQNQRKRMQKFHASGTASLSVAETAEVAEACIGEILAVKRKWLVSTGRVSRAFTDERAAACLRDLARSLASPGASPRTLIAKLTLDGAMAAMEVGFVHRGVYYLYMGAFSEALGRLGPGNVLTEKVMEWCVENGIRRYDMMAPRTRNKGEWQTGEVEVTDRILPLTALGRLYAATVIHRISPALRNGFYRLPDKWRSAIAQRSLKI